MDRAVREWADRTGLRGAGIVRIGYFGSYARGDWGVGSDVDIVVILAESSDAFERRALAFDANALPVPSDVLVYTAAEWSRMSETGGLPKTVASELIWVYPPGDAG